MRNEAGVFGNYLISDASVFLLSSGEKMVLIIKLRKERVPWI